MVRQQQQQQRPSSLLLGRPTSHRPSATTVKLTHLLDGKKKKKKKQSRTQQRTTTTTSSSLPPPCRRGASNDVQTTTTTTTSNTDIFGTAQGLTLAELDAARKKKQKQEQQQKKKRPAITTTTTTTPITTHQNCSSTQQRPRATARVSIRPPPTTTILAQQQNVPPQKKRRITAAAAASTTAVIPQRGSHAAAATTTRAETVPCRVVVEDTRTPPLLGITTTTTHGVEPMASQAPTTPQDDTTTSVVVAAPEQVSTAAARTEDDRCTKPCLYGAAANNNTLTTRTTLPSFSKRSRWVERHAPTHFACSATATTTTTDVEEKEELTTTLHSSSSPPASLSSTQPNASTAHFPRLHATTTAPNKQQQQPKANYVRLNMKNAAGACRFHRKKQSKKYKRNYSSTQQERTNTAPLPAATTIDPVDDYLDGVYTTSTSTQQRPKQQKKTTTTMSIPLCSGHQQPCIRRVVQKAGPNKCRPFFVCPCRTRAEQCSHFAWADDTDTAAAARAVLLSSSSSRSGFLARHVQAYRERMALYTVPELRVVAERHGLESRGTKQALRTRLAVWVRDELVAGLLDNGGGGDDEALQEEKNEDGVDSSDDENDECSADDEEEDGRAIGKAGTSEEALVQDEHQWTNEPSDQVVPVIQRPDKGGAQFIEFADDSSDEDSDGEDAPFDMSKKPLTAPPCKVASEDKSPQSVLQELFGFDEFRQGQEWAVKRCLAKQRSLLVAPTGSGKSLCYALPASMMKGVCIVVSPLLSLIDDQIRHLPVRLASATLSGPMTAASTAATVDDVVRGRIRILFVSPERLTSASFRRLFRPRWNNETKTYEKAFPPVSLLCVDEAHTLSQVSDWNFHRRAQHSPQEKLHFPSGPTTSDHLTCDSNRSSS